MEQNKDAQLFLSEFTNLRTSVLKQMELDFHILKERGNSKLGAYSILSVLQDKYGRLRN